MFFLLLQTDSLDDRVGQVTWNDFKILPTEPDTLLIYYYLMFSSFIIFKLIKWFFSASAMDISAGEDGAATKADQLKNNNDNFFMFLTIGIIAGTFAWVYTSLFKITGYRQGAVWLIF